MRAFVIVGGLIAALGAIWLWGSEGMDRLAREAALSQREVQNAMAGAIRRLRAGEPRALAGLWAFCLAYGVLHAAGPGHGKMVIGAYGFSGRVPMTRLAGLALASSLAQSLTAVGLVGAGVLAFGWTRERMQEVADRHLALLSNLLVAGVGAWLLWRGLRGLWRLTARRPAPQAAHIHDRFAVPALEAGRLEPEVCAACGHAHGPTPEQAARVRSLREASMLVLAIAARPCTGALFLLILTWRMDIFGAGVVGALLMGIGTALVTLVAAAGAVALRESALLAAWSGPATARVLLLGQMLAGALVIALALQLMRQGI